MFNSWGKPSSLRPLPTSYLSTSRLPDFLKTEENKHSLLKPKVSEIKESGKKICELLEQFKLEENALHVTPELISQFLSDLDGFLRGEKNLKNSKIFEKIPLDQPDAPLLLKKEWICFAAYEVVK